MPAPSSLLPGLLPSCLPPPPFPFPLSYQNPHEAQLLFGRGFRAGIDRREQKKTAAESEADMQKRMRDQLGA